MALTTITTGNRAQQYDADVFKEYVRENPFARFMGTNENAAIQIKEKLGKMPGDAITVSLIGRMTGANIGTGIAEGNEEVIGDFSHRITVEVVRNAFAINNFEDQVSAFDIKMAGKVQLKNWAMDLLRNDILESLHSRASFPYGGGSTNANDLYQSANDDRMIYVGTSNTGDHSADLLTLTAGTDKMDASVVSAARLKARTADPKIKPIRVNGSEEYFVMFLDPYAFRDLAADPVIQAARSDALARGENNPLFTAGNIIWDGVVCVEVPEIADFIDGASALWGAAAINSGLDDSGAAGTRVGVSFLLGAQAVGIAYAKRMKTTTDTRDYGFIKGFGVEEFRGVEKLLFQVTDIIEADHGLVTVYSSSLIS